MRLGQLPCELHEELLYDAEVEQEKADEWMVMLLDSQRTMVEAVLHAVQHSLHFRHSSTPQVAQVRTLLQFTLGSSARTRANGTRSG